MKKRIMITLVITILLATSLTVFADGEQSIISKITGLSDDLIAELRTEGVGYGQLIPASIISKSTGLDIKDVIALRKAGKSYYQIAVDNGISEEAYKSEMLEVKYSYIDERVNAGQITEEQAELMKDRMAASIENCDGQGGMNGQGICGGLGTGSCEAGNGMMKGNRAGGNGMRGNGMKGNGQGWRNSVTQ